jgi:DNA-binding MarR family transcriptional regulator
MTEASDQILFGFGRLAALLRTGHRQGGAAFDLNPAQVEILLRVAAHPARAGALAEHLGVSAASVSDSISSLEAKGHVDRRPDPLDRRAQQIHPTKAGLAAAAALAAGPTPLRASLDTLGSADEAALLRALTLLIRALQQARAIPVQRMCATCRHFRPRVHADAGRPHHCAFVDAAFGDASLRLDCGDHEAAPAEEAAALWRRFEAA